MKRSSLSPWLSSVFVILLLTTHLIHAQKITRFDVPNGSHTFPTAMTPSGDVVGSFLGTNVYGQTIRRGFLRKADGTITVFDAENELQPGTDPTAVNPSRQIVGDYAPDEDPDMNLGFVRNVSGSVTLFTVQGRERVDPKGIDPLGEVVGTMSSFYSSLSDGFVREPDGTVSTVDVGSIVGPGGTSITAINPAGKSTGSYGETGLWERGFLREADGNIITFGVLNATNTTPVAIDSRGQIAGSYYDADSEVAGGFLRDADGNITTFGVRNATNTTPVAIDSRGQIAGYYYDANFAVHGFLRKDDGSITTFDVPNATGTIPTAMDSRGQITGMYIDSQRIQHGFVLSQ